MAGHGGYHIGDAGLVWSGFGVLVPNVFTAASFIGIFVLALAGGAVKISIDLSALRQTKWYEYAIRFLFGGSMTATAGIIAKEYGPTLGGLFLAFPAILPATVTLIEKHEKQRKQRAGVEGTCRARKAAALSAAGAAMGSFGLLVFALLIWRLLPDHSALFVIAGSTLAWAAVALLIWIVRKQM